MGDRKGMKVNLYSPCLAIVARGTEGKGSELIKNRTFTAVHHHVNKEDLKGYMHVKCSPPLPSSNYFEQG